VTRPAADEVEARLRRHRAELIDEALRFPAVYREYQRYQGDYDLAALQRERMASLLAHAAARVPVYRGLAVDDPISTLARFPLVAKAELRANLADHCDDELDPAQCRAVFTTGTSGQPLRVLHDADHLAHTAALALRRAVRLGLPFDRKVLHPFHSNLDRWVEYTSAGSGFARVAEFGSTGDEAYWSEVVERIRGFRPDVVVGHPTACVRLAELLAGLDATAPVAVLTWGERLAPGMAERITTVLGAPVLDGYGLREVSTVAAQCASGAYHIEGERIWVEVVDDSGAAVPDGEVGELVVTNLVNRAMPLIRYRTGDLGSLAPAGQRCACGLPHRMLTLVEGRTPGSLVRPDGSRAPTIVLLRKLARLPVERYQVVQVARDEVRVIVKRLDGFTPEHQRSIVEDAVALLGAAVRVELDLDGGFVAHGGRKAVDFVSLLPEGDR
jgi:phenylacetate-CoA ligase